MSGRTDQELLRRRQGEVALVAEVGDVLVIGLLEVLVCGHGWALQRVVEVQMLVLGVVLVLRRVRGARLVGRVT